MRSFDNCKIVVSKFIIISNKSFSRITSQGVSVVPGRFLGFQGIRGGGWGGEVLWLPGGWKEFHGCQRIPGIPESWRATSHFFLIVSLEAFLIGNLDYNISDEGFKKPRSDRVGCPVTIVDGTKLTNKTLEKLLCYAIWVPVFLFRISKKIL